MFYCACVQLVLMLGLLLIASVLGLLISRSRTRIPGNFSFSIFLVSRKTDFRERGFSKYLKLQDFQRKFPFCHIKFVRSTIFLLQERCLIEWKKKNSFGGKTLKFFSYLNMIFLHNFSVFMIWCLDILFLVIQSVKAKHGIYFCTYVYMCIVIMINIFKKLLFVFLQIFFAWDS